MTAENERLLIYAGAAALGVLIFLPELFGRAVGTAAVGAGKVVVRTAEGVVIGLGESVGIPPTDAAKCEAYVASGDWWNASFYCPAGTFLKSAAGAVYDTVTGAVVGTAPPSSAPSIITIAPAPAPGPNAVDIWDIPQPPEPEFGGALQWDTAA